MRERYLRLAELLVDWQDEDAAWRYLLRWTSGYYDLK